MTLVVTGASGHLGHLTVQALLDLGVAADQIVATARRPEALADLADKGVVVRRADYTDPESLKAAFEAADRVLLVSSSEIGQRVQQHRNVIDAAREAGVSLIVYTSAPGADTTKMLLAAEHAATEQLLRDSGLDYVILRNSWYLENYTEQLATALEHKAILGSAGNGRVSGASRADYAAAAAAVLAGDGPSNHTYELGGDTAFTMAEYAATLSGLVGETITYVNQPPEEYQAFLESVGLPGPVAHVMADADVAVSRDDLFVETGDLSRLIGRPTTTLTDAIRSAMDAGAQ